MKHKSGNLASENIALMSFIMILLSEPSEGMPSAFSESNNINSTSGNNAPKVPITMSRNTFWVKGSNLIP
jgi:hypothetical protein